VDPSSAASSSSPSDASEPNPILLYVKFLTGELIAIECQPADTVLEVKKLISLTDPSVEIADQTLLLMPRQQHDSISSLHKFVSKSTLLDHKTLSEYGVQSEDVIELIVTVCSAAE
jgi:hypothetical protein